MNFPPTTKLTNRLKVNFFRKNIKKPNFSNIYIEKFGWLFSLLIKPLLTEESISRQPKQYRSLTLVTALLYVPVTKFLP